jgi:hypothetical protein
MSSDAQQSLHGFLSFSFRAGKTLAKSSTLQSVMIHESRMSNLNDGRFQRLRRHALRMALVGSALLAFGQSNITGARFSAVMPLGSDSIVLRPAKQRLNMLVSVECPEFEKLVVKGDIHDRIVIDAAGNPVRHYPNEISFRFTIGSRTSTDEARPNEVESKATVDHFQSTLHFRLKVFHGTESKIYEPTDLKMLGVPVDVPFDERIYHFSFKLKDVPVEDRMMLEVLDEQGNRVGKFHLQLI